METKQQNDRRRQSITPDNYISLINCKLEHGPIIGSQQTFTMTYKLCIDPFYYVDNHNSFTWKINYQYGHFKDLDDLINSIGNNNNFIHSDFPINYRKTAIGFKLTPSKLEERRYMLELWIKEVLANYCNFPYLIRSNIENFIDIPHDIEKKYHSYLSTIQVANKLGLNKSNSSDVVNSNNSSASNSPASDKVMDANTIRNNIVNIIQSNIDNDNDSTTKDYHLRSSRLPSPLALQLRSLLEKLLYHIGLDNTNINPYMLPKTCCTQTFMISSKMDIIIDNKSLSLLGHFLLGVYQQKEIILTFTCIYFMSMYYTSHHHFSLWLSSVLTYIGIWYKEEITIDSFNNDDNNFFKENDNKKKVLKLFLRSESSIKYFNKTNTNNNNSDTYDTIKSNIIADINIDSEKTENIDSAAPVEESTSPSSPPSSSSSSCRFKGTSVADLEFLDVCKNQRDMFEDRQSCHTITVRGLSYLKDNKKVHAGPAISKMVLLEMYEVEDLDCDRHDHVASRGLAKKRVEAITSLPGQPFVIVINYQLPGDPPVSLVSYFAVPSLEELQNDPKFADYPVDKWYKLFQKFISLPTEEDRLASWQKKSTNIPKSPSNSSVDPNAQIDDEDEDEEKSKSAFSFKLPSDITWAGPESPGVYIKDDFRNARFKLIPNITDGPWVVKAAVRSKPALIGRKVVCRYFKTATYMELDVNVSSSIIASQIIGVCRGYAKHFTADVGIVIQGEDEEELPEMLLSVGSVRRINTAVRRKLDD